jgi:membrane protein
MITVMKYIRTLLIIVVGLFLAGAKRVMRRKQGGDYVDTNSDIDSPADLTKKGWKAALLRTKRALKDKDLSSYAAALSYYTTLTFFPAVLGLATLYTAVAGPGGLLGILKHIELVVPPAIQDLLQTQLGPLARAPRSSLGVAALASLVTVLWTTSGGVQNLIKALNVAYGVRETRNIVKLRLTSLGLSVVFIIFGAVILALLVMQGDALHALGVPAALANLFPVLRWPLLVLAISLVLAIIYRYAPNRREPRWGWVSWGATAATIIWLIGTVLFFFYVQHLGNFNKSYGTFAGIIILMIWFNLSSLIVLVGAQVNKKLEEVTNVDTAV